MPEFPNILLPAIPAFILLIALEVLYAYKTQRELYQITDAATSIALGIGNLLTGFVTKAVIAWVFFGLYQHRLFTLPYTAWWVIVIGIFADDFSYYWFHRLSHSIRWFWASHVVHHSSEKYNLAAALRQTWTGNATGCFLFWTWMPLVGFHPAVVMLLQSVSLLYQFWIHTESIQKMPRWFEAIMNTPSHHRVHHGTDLEYLDKNHAGIFIIWDKLFGTFQEEKQTPTYGLTKNVNTFHPVKVAFHEWIHLWNDVRRAPSWKQALQYITRAPGWSHDGRTQTTEQLRNSVKKLS
ncbi:MAG: sterol desaturase family protein [Bacteroidetes bacterium]|nr:MAG: sterol desaturase family protein [Bacteroidota bacterium]TAF93944.1 MAG: sterol desaturase family protein [Bacteroidota bacterium]